MTLLLRDRENIEKGRAEGREEGWAEGRAEGRTELILSVLKKYTAEEAAALLSVSIEEVLKVQQGAVQLV